MGDVSEKGNGGWWCGSERRINSLKHIDYSN